MPAFSHRLPAERPPFPTARRCGRRLLSGLAVALLSALPAAAAISATQLLQLQDDLGVVLTVEQAAELDAIVNPAAVEAWRTEAEARIAAHRQANLTLTLRDRDGAPLIGATVRLRQRSRPFKFGGVLDLKMLHGVSTNQPTISVGDYRNRAVALFDAFGLNNGLKPKQMGAVSDPAANQNLLPGFFSWAASVSRPVRGHLLIWPGQDHLSATVEAKTAEIEALIALRDAAADPQVIAGYNAQIEMRKPELRALVDAEITGWASRWTVTEWDVINEAITNTRLQAILGDAEMVRWFQLAQAAQPNARRLINEFQIISGNAAGSGPSRLAAYRAIIDGLRAGNAPITGIGFQSRFTYRREDPALLYSRLEQFVPYGLPLTGTEFEVADRERDGDSFIPTEALRAQITEEVMTTYFSHPSVNALYAWTYLSPGSTSALLASDGTPKLNGLVWYYLTRFRYRTDTELTTDATGRVSLRAFRGDYDLQVEIGGQTATRTLTLPADATEAWSTALTQGQVTTAAVVADAFVRRDQPNTTFANGTLLDLRRSDQTNGRLVYLRFTLPAVAAVPDQVLLTLSVPSLASETNAETDPVTVALAPNAGTWTESSLTWNNRPAVSAVLATASGTAGGTLQFSLPATVWPREGGTVTFVLDEQAGSYGRLYSRESGFGATLQHIAPLDTDADGMSDAWERAHHLDPASSLDALLDLDGDGRPNLLEALLGRDPWVAEPLDLDLRLEPVAGDRLRLEFRRSADGPRVQFTARLEDGWGGSLTESALTAAGFILHHVTVEPENERLAVERWEFSLGTARGFFARLAAD